MLQHPHRDECVIGSCNVTIIILNILDLPFQAFGSTRDDGWFRLSVGAVSEEQIREALPRLGAALRSLR